MPVKYIGTGVIRHGNRPVLPGESIAASPEVEAQLAKRNDFETIEPPEPEKAPAKKGKR